MFLAFVWWCLGPRFHLCQMDIHPLTIPQPLLFFSFDVPKLDLYQETPPRSPPPPPPVAGRVFYFSWCGLPSLPFGSTPSSSCPPTSEVPTLSFINCLDSVWICTKYIFPRELQSPACREPGTPGCPPPDRWDSHCPRHLNSQAGQVLQPWEL